MVFHADAVEIVCFPLGVPFDAVVMAAAAAGSNASCGKGDRANGARAWLSQNADGTDATMLDLLSLIGSSASCHSQSTGDTDAAMLYLEQDVLMEAR